MRTMLNPGSSLSNPAERFLRWSGKTEIFKDKETGKIEYEGGFVYYDDKDNDYETVKLAMPLVLYPLGEAMSIYGGVFDAANKSANTFLNSSEFASWDEPITVYERGVGDERGAIIARGLWEDIKTTVKAHNGKVRTNLYALTELNGERVIVRFEASGSASRALSDIRRKAGASFYNRPLIISGVEYKVNGSVHYAAPVFTKGEAYDEATIEGLTPYATTISEYGNALRDKNMAKNSQMTITDETSDEDYDKAVAQDGDAEVIPEDVDKLLDLSDVPF